LIDLMISYQVRNLGFPKYDHVQASIDYVLLVLGRALDHLRKVSKLTPNKQIH